MFAPAPKEQSSLYNPINFQSSISGEDPITSSEAKNLFASKNGSNVFTNIQSFNSPVALNSGLLVDGTNITNTNLLKLNAAEQVITQDPALSGTNTLVASSFSGTLTANGNTVSKDVACDNLTIRAGKTIIQPTVSAAWNSLQKTRITDLEISGTLKLPTGATVEGITTYSDDLVLLGNSVIVQTNSATETNSLGNTNFNGTIVNFASSINQTNASAISALKNLTVVGNCVLPVFTSPTITSINTTIATKSNSSNPVISDCLTTSWGSGGGVFSSSDTANRETGLYVRMFQAVNSLALFTMGGTNNRFEWRKDTTTLMNLDGNANLNVVGDITGPTISSLTARLAALEGQAILQPSIAGWGHTWGNSDTQRRQSYPFITTTEFYGPLYSQNTITVNPGFRLVLYSSNSFVGVQNNINNTTGTTPLSLFHFAPITFKSVQVYYKNVLVDLPNNAP
jgi:hypothetical protein